MGKILAIFKIYPESPECVKQIESELKSVKTAVFKDLKKEPLAFGLQLVKVAFLIPESEGLLERLETELKSIKGVQQVEAAGATLV